MTAKGMVMIQNKVVNTFKRLEYAASLLYIIFFHSRCGFSESIVLQCVQDHNKKTPLNAGLSKIKECDKICAICRELVNSIQNKER